MVIDFSWVIAHKEGKIPLKTARLRQGLTLEDVAVYLGVNTKTVTRWEKGVTKPGKLQYLMDICDLYDVEIDDLYF